MKVYGTGFTLSGHIQQESLISTGGADIKLWYDTIMEVTVVPIGFAKFGQVDSEEAAKKHFKIVQRMANGGWFSGPRRPEDIPKDFEVFRTKKHRKAKLIYTILIARSTELGGVTKMSNKHIAIALKEQYNCDISERQVNRAITFLVNKGVIARHIHFLPGRPHTRLNKDYKPGYFKPKTIRMFMVWISFFACLTKCKAPGYSGFRIDTRVKCDQWDRYMKKINLKYKVHKTKEFQSKRGIVKVEPFFGENPSDNWEKLRHMGAIDPWQEHQVRVLSESATYVGGNGKLPKIKIMGRTESMMYYLGNKEAIDRKRRESKERREAMRSISSGQWGLL